MFVFIGCACNSIDSDLIGHHRFMLTSWLLFSVMTIADASSSLSVGSILLLISGN